MTFNVNDRIFAQLSDQTGKKISPLLSGTVAAVNGDICTIKWSNYAVGEIALSLFHSNNIDQKYLILA